MSYFGLTPSEYSSGEKRQQGGITKAGNGACRRALVEAAHQYRIAPRVSPAMQQRQEGQNKEVRAIAWKAQQRLHERYRVLSARHKKAVVVVAAVAREWCGFVWAIACQIRAPHKVKMRGQTPAQETQATTPKTSTASPSSKDAAVVKRIYGLKPATQFKKK